MPAAELLFETLRLRLRADPDDLARAWARTDPRGLYALADYERGAMWILRRLEDIEAEAGAPAAFVGPLRRHVDNALPRNLLVDAEAAVVLKLLAREGIGAVLLKGVARRASGTRFPCGDARTTTNVDLLTAPDHTDRARTVLLAGGYRPTADAPARSDAHRLVGDSRITVTLHTRMTSTQTPEESWQRANDDARLIDWNGLKVTVPAPTELLWHAVTHALWHGTMAWRLRFFLDAASILGGEEPVAWDMIGARLDKGEVAASSSPRRWLDAAAQLAGADLPPGILGRARPLDIVRILRWRISVLGDMKNSGFGGRLLEEGIRRELRIGVAPRTPGTNLYRRTRRRLGGLAARVVYGVWTATGARPMRI